MRALFAIAFCGMLAGCAGTADDARNALSGRYVGQNIDVFVSQFGPPANSFKMQSGDTSHIWQLSNLTSIDSNKYGGTAQTHYCKVNVITDAKGVVKLLNTEDASNMLGESLCSKRLGIQRPT